MNCEKYNELTIVEKTQFIGELVHIVQSDDGMFSLAKALIKSGKNTGLLNDVKILPNEILETN